MLHCTHRSCVCDGILLAGPGHPDDVLHSFWSSAEESLVSPQTWGQPLGLQLEHCLLLKMQRSCSWHCHFWFLKSLVPLCQWHCRKKGKILYLVTGRNTICQSAQSVKNRHGVNNVCQSFTWMWPRAQGTWLHYGKVVLRRWFGSTGPQTPPLLDTLPALAHS